MSYGPYDYTIPPASDPLVPRNFNEWFNNSIAAVKRSCPRVVGVFALWSIVPVVGGIVQSVLLQPAAARFNEITRGGGETMSQRETATMWNSMGEVLLISGIGVLAGLVLAYFTAAGWAAALRIVLTDAAGRPIAFKEAMIYGARRGLTMWGWYTLATLCVLVGLCLCLLPGAYLAVVFALFVPVVVCEGGPALARSLRLVHRSFGKMLGRIVLTGAAVFIATLLLGVVQTIVALVGLGVGFQFNAGIESTATDLIVNGLFSWASGLLTAAIAIPALLVTYAEARVAESGPVTAAELLERSPA